MERILVVDDDNDLRAVIRDVLKEEGFATSEAEDGVSAVKQFKKDRPDAVLLDLNMPYMNGIDTMHEIRRIGPDVPVIILTGYGDIPTAVDAVKNGVYDFLIKPPEFDRLVFTLRKALEKSRLETEVRRTTTALESSLEYQLGRMQDSSYLSKQPPNTESRLSDRHPTSPTSKPPL